jgi:serine/threonine-protein kinase
MGVVHRDLKPANLFLTHRKDGTPLVKVLDFGISKSSALNEQGAGALTKTGGIMGSPLYMSPEQMKSAKDTDGRTDIWALGVILYELLGGRPPFDSDTIGGLMALVLTEPPPPLASVRGGLPPGLSEVVSGCLQKDRNLRWPSIAHLARALAPFAPPRAQGLVERISIVLGQGAAAMPPPAARAPSAPAHAASMTGAGGIVATSPGWGTTAAPAKSGKGALFAVVGVLGLVAIVAIVGGIVAVRSSASHSVAAATASAAPSAASDPTPAPTAAATPPPTATTAPAAPPVTAESAPASAVPEAPAVAPSAPHGKTPPTKKAAGATPPPATTAPAPTKAAPSKPVQPAAGGLFDTSN